MRSSIEREMRAASLFRSLIISLAVLASSHASADGPPELLARMVGTWDVAQRMWPGPGAAPIDLPRAVAQRRLVRDMYLEEIMQPADDRDGQSGAFSRHAILNYNAVTSRYEYTSIDTRASQLMVEQSGTMRPEANVSELKLDGGTFLARQWGDSKNVRFKYRLTIEPVKNDRQAVRLYFTPQTVVPKNEFLAFEYIYTKKS